MIQGTMLTVGTIKEKYYDNDTLIYKVDLPVFKSPGVQESKLTSTILEATACVSPGTYEPYNIEDQVYIGFINNELNQPVILGKIAKKLNSDEKSSALNKINSLEVVDSAKLPISTNIGNISYADLQRAATYVKLNIDNEDSGGESNKSYLHTLNYDDGSSKRIYVPFILNEQLQDFSDLKDWLTTNNYTSSSTPYYTLTGSYNGYTILAICIVTDTVYIGYMANGNYSMTWTSIADEGSTITSIEI